MKAITFAKNVVNNRLSWLFVTVHWFAVGIMYFFKPAQQGFSYHFSEEPWYYHVLFTLDFPAILATGLIFYPLYSQGNETPFLVGVYYLVLLLLTSLQWALIGFLVHKIYKH